MQTQKQRYNQWHNKRMTLDPTYLYIESILLKWNHKECIPLTYSNQLNVTNNVSIYMN